MDLKPSRFNVLLEDDHLAFNSLTCALVQFNHSFQKILQNPNSTLTQQDNLLRKQMISCGFLVPSNLDELSTLRSRYLQSQYNRDSLAITIMPWIYNVKVDTKKRRILVDTKGVFICKQRSMTRTLKSRL